MTQKSTIETYRDFTDFRYEKLNLLRFGNSSSYLLPFSFSDIPEPFQVGKYMVFSTGQLNKDHPIFDSEIVQRKD